MLAQKDLQGIEDLDIPARYKDLAREIIDRDLLEIRTDYIHSSYAFPISESCVSIYEIQPLGLNSFKPREDESTISGNKTKTSKIIPFILKNIFG